MLPAHIRPFGFVFACRSVGDVNAGLIEIRHRINPDQYIQVYYLARGFAPSSTTSELTVFRDIRMKKTMAEGFYVRDSETGLASTRPVPKMDPETNELVLYWDMEDITQKLTLEIIGDDHGCPPDLYPEHGAKVSGAPRECCRVHRSIPSDNSK